jgi:hypothetical protein
MSVTQSVSPETIQAHIQDATGAQIAVGSYILQIGHMSGGVVNFLSPEQQPRLRRRPTPVLLLPRPFPGLLDRATEINVAEAALRSGLPVEFYGQAGMGKTVLLRHLAFYPLGTTFPDGVAHLSAHRQPLADLLQALVDAF